MANFFQTKYFIMTFLKNNCQNISMTSDQYAFFSIAKMPLKHIYNNYYMFFYKHNVYKHIQAQVQSKNNHMVSILLSLKLTVC